VVELDFEFITPSLYFGKIGEGEKITKSAYLQVKDPAEIEILDIETGSPLISARKVGYGEKEKNKRIYEIEVTIGPGLPVGQFLDTVTVHSNLARKPMTILRLTGIVSGAVEVTPPSLTFMVNTKETSGRSRTKTVYITNYVKDVPLEILEVIDQDDHVEFELDPTEVEEKFKLTVTLTEEDVPEGGNLNGSIKIITNNPNYKELLVYYSAVWRI